MMAKYLAIKKRTFEIISKAESGDRASSIFDWSIMILIALSILTIILDSFQSIHERCQTLFQAFEIITVIVFTIVSVISLKALAVGGPGRPLFTVYRLKSSILSFTMSSASTQKTP